MEIEDLSPQNRVFHIDDECYVIYLGSSPEDYKPFLRIGNSNKLTKEIISIIYSIVITDSYTGNPVLEPSNINEEELTDIQYVGDKTTVERFLKFLKHYGIDSEKIAYAKDLPAQNHNAMLYVYENGNVALYYDKSQLFDLFSREKNDVHFVEKTKRIKDELIKNPLRYTDSEFDGYGLFAVDGCGVVFHQQQFVSFDVPENYFAALASQGFDPDLISTVATDTVTGDFIGLCKRKMFKKQNLQFLSLDPAHVRNALGLFSARTQGASKFSVDSSKAAAKKTESGFSIKGEKGGFTVSSGGIPFSISIGPRPKKIRSSVLAFNPQKGLMVIPSGAKLRETKILNGIPYIIHADSPEPTSLFERYFNDFSSSLEALFTAEETSLVKHLTQSLSEIESGIDAEQSFGYLKKQLKALRVKDTSPLPLLLHNVCEICSIRLSSSQAEGAAHGTYTQLFDLLKKHLGFPTGSPGHYPFICDCYISEKSAYVLYRGVKRGIRQKDFAQLQDAVGAIQGATRDNLVFFEQETARLSDFLAKLSFVARPRRAKAAEKEEKKIPEAGGEERPSEPTEREELVVGKTLTAQKRSIHMPKIFLIIAAVIIVLCIILFAPPFSLVQKTTQRIRTEKQLLAGKGEQEEAPGAVEAEMAQQDEKAPAAVSEEVGDAALSEAEKQEIESFLSLGYIQITIFDVFKLTNTIALSNGYYALNSVDKLGRDPDWIYPGNTFTLPDGNTHTVVKGDTIWHIAKNFIKKYLDRDWEHYTALRDEIKTKEISVSRKQEIIGELERLKEGSYAENFVKEIDKTIEELR
jgi:hypothetical protein